jgi:hypothetical protein
LEADIGRSRELSLLTLLAISATTRIGLVEMMASAPAVFIGLDIISTRLTRWFQLAIHGIPPTVELPMDRRPPGTPFYASISQEEGTE